MIPMGVGKKDLGIDRPVREMVGHQIVTEFPETGPGVYDDQPVQGLKSQGDTGRISAVFYRVWARTGDRTPYSPKLYSHRLNLCV